MPVLTHSLANVFMPGQQRWMHHAIQVQIGSLTSVAGWQSQAWAMQKIGIDLFAEAKEASQTRVAVIPH